MNRQKGKTHPIMMQGFSLDGIKNGIKTQTRRAVRPQPEVFTEFGEGLERTQHVEWKKFRGKMEDLADFANPYGAVGDQLWVRESWRFIGWGPFSFDIQYEKDGEVREEVYVGEDFKDSSVERYYEQCEDDCVQAGMKQFEEDGSYAFTPANAPTRWRSSRYMPKWVSRISLEITEPVRIERAQDISDEDCVREGILLPELSPEALEMMAKGHWVPRPSLISEYAIVWDSLNNKRGFPWRMNPYVYVISFKVVEW